ncbi:MAG TPA: A24 family peptidase [Anaerolineae bacterium]|nr:A24 family peptidase [Anaerolineae bacterium]
MSVFLGSLLGLAAGLGAWLAERFFVSRAAAGPQPGTPQAELSAQWLSPVLAAALLALWGGYTAWRSGSLGVACAAVCFTALLLALSLVDLRVRRLPDALLLLLLAWAAVEAAWLGRPTWLSAGAGLLFGGGLFLLIALVRRGAMGAGDVKLAAVLGAALGFPDVVTALLWGVLAGGLAALALLVTRRAGRKDYMAYGPYLALGAWLVWTRAAGLWP